MLTGDPFVCNLYRVCDTPSVSLQESPIFYFSLFQLTFSRKVKVKHECERMCELSYKCRQFDTVTSNESIFTSQNLHIPAPGLKLHSSVTSIDPLFISSSQSTCEATPGRQLQATGYRPPIVISLFQVTFKYSLSNSVPQSNSLALFTYFRL